MWQGTGGGYRERRVICTLDGFFGGHKLDQVFVEDTLSVNCSGWRRGGGRFLR